MRECRCHRMRASTEVGVVLALLLTFSLPVQAEGLDGLAGPGVEAPAARPAKPNKPARPQVTTEGAASPIPPSGRRGEEPRIERDPTVLPHSSQEHKFGNWMLHCEEHSFENKPKCAIIYKNAQAGIIFFYAPGYSDPMVGFNIPSLDQSNGMFIRMDEQLISIELIPYYLEARVVVGNAPSKLLNKVRECKRALIRYFDKDVRNWVELVFPLNGFAEAFAALEKTRGR